MRLVSVVTAVAALLLCTNCASAFSMDSSSGTAPDGSSRYVDRVEDGRGSLGPLAIAPFPIPAHQ